LILVLAEAAEADCGCAATTISVHAAKTASTLSRTRFTAPRFDIGPPLVAG
jgi:hypothetical protein